MIFFNTKDLSELTTNMMSDCSSMESLLSSTIPPLIANGITVTLTCILLAFFDWRLALCVFCTVPLAFLIIWLSRKHQIKLFEKQVKAKLNASDQVQEYLEGMKIIKSLDNALLTTPAMEGKEKEVSNCDIELLHVTFAYNQENVIKDISCKIPQGSVTALVGPSGSGKSIW